MKAKRILKVLGLLGVVGGLVTVIVRTVLAAPPSKVRASDKVNARRLVSPMSGDDRRAIGERGYVAGNGIVEPASREIRVAGAESGQISRVLVREGQRVKKGAVLAILESAAELASWRAAKTDLAVAVAELERVRAGLRREDRQVAAADARVARERSRLSQGIYRRTRALALRGGVSRDELDRARRGAAADRAALDAALARSGAAAAGARGEDIEVARAKVVAARARAASAYARLQRRRIRAPLSGEILQLKVRPGEFYQASASQPLAVMGDTRRLRVRMDVEERDIGRLRLGAPAFVTAAAFRGHRFAGKLVTIGRRMGRKNLRSDDPVERIDTKILEVVIDLAQSRGLVPGLRVVGYIKGRARLERRTVAER